MKTKPKTKAVEINSEVELHALFEKAQRSLSETFNKMFGPLTAGELFTYLFKQCKTRQISVSDGAMLMDRFVMEYGNPFGARTTTIKGRLPKGTKLNQWVPGKGLQEAS